MEPGSSWVSAHGEHLTKLNSSLKKVLDSINPCTVCRRMLSEHKDKSSTYQRAHGLEFVLYDLRRTFATRMLEAGCSLPALAAMVRYEEYLASSGRAAMRTASIRRSMCELLLVLKDEVPTNAGSTPGPLWFGY